MKIFQLEYDKTIIWISEKKNHLAEKLLCTKESTNA